MKLWIKNFTAIVIIITINIFSLVSAQAALADWQLPEDISPIQVELPQKKLYADFYFLDNKIDFENKPYLSTGRVYVPFSETVEAMGGELTQDGCGYSIKLDTGKFYINKEDDDTYPKRVINIDGVEYVSLFKLLAGSGYEPVFDTSINRIDIFYAQRNIAYNTAIMGEKHSAYLRLEDIMADGVDPEGYYNDIGLEKLRTISDYLYKNGQKFYIAWIPFYKNPTKGIENNLTTEFNLYNASFLYTLDYLVYRGGKIGVHGYTHQYNNEKSADGYEFGEKTPFSDTECVNRLLLAKKTARDLGYCVSFFEFPHYGATADQLRYAEKYYDVIYQQDTSVITKGYIVNWTRANGRKIKYVPTPADYIVNRYDIDGINSRIDYCISKGQELSLFYHPRIDFEVMEIKTQNNIRMCNMPENSVLYKVVEKVFSKKRTFGYF